MQVKTIFLQAIKSRMFIALWVLMLIQTIILAIMVAVNIHPQQLQIPVRFDAFSGEQYFRDQWFYLFNFVAFAAVVFIVNCLVSLKILDEKGRHLALGFLWLALSVMLIATILMAIILKVAGIR